MYSSYALPYVIIICYRYMTSNMRFMYAFDICIQIWLRSFSHMTCFIIINLSDSSVSRSVHDTNSICGPKLSSIIKPAGKDHGLTVLYRSTRGMISAANALHRDTWDSVLCEGVPVSMRELVLLVADQLDMNADLRNAHKLLLCSWSLGWHVKGGNVIQANLWLYPISFLLALRVSLLR